MGWFGDILGVIPGIGDAVDLAGGIFGFDDTSRNNASNEQIAKWNIEQQQRNNENNLQITRETNEANQNIASAYNANQVQLQNSMNVFNKQMWDLNNQYNSPSQQLARARAAGINPNIVFGQPVASSPVQQTSIPNQEMARMEAYHTSPLHNDMRYQSRRLESISNALRGLSKLPFIKEELDLKREDLKSKRLDNEVKEFNKWDREQIKKMYENFTLFRSPDGHTVTPEEYGNLSDIDKRKFQSVIGYRNQISDKSISVDEYNSLPDSQKKIYTPEYGAPEVLKSLFHSKEQYVTYKSLQSLGSTLTNISADNLQQLLRKKVLSNQLESSPTISALSFMPLKEFEMIGYEIKKTIEDIDSLKKHNAGLSQRLETQDRMATYTADRMLRDSNRDVIKIIQQYVPEGGYRDFLISAYAIFKDLK